MKRLGAVSLITLVLTMTWLVLLIASMVSAGLVPGHGLPLWMMVREPQRRDGTRGAPCLKPIKSPRS